MKCFLNGRRKKPLVVLTGSTAVGKTSLSIQLAKTIGGEIISADSMQIYKKMNIGTAKITSEEMEGVPHYLLNELDPEDEFNVVEFQCRAKRAMEQIYQNGHIPVVVGGTGFYIQALLYDIDFSRHEEEETLRKELEQLFLDRGKEYLYRELKRVDPEYAAAIHSNNIKRIIRALEYYLETGEKLSSHNEKQRKKSSPYCFAYFVLEMERSILYERINQRVDQMMDEGLENEVRKLWEEGYTKDLVSMQGIGYKEFFDYFENRISLRQVTENIKKDTRHFAKRQMTWFRREKEVLWINKHAYSGEEAVLEEMLRILKDKGITGNNI